MTDRFNSLTVVLAVDTRDDDAKGIIDAIKLLRGVIAVEGNVVNSESFTANARARHELGQKLIDIVYPKVGP
jgi:hypothetical protein